MPKINLRLGHSLSQSEALSRIKTLLEQLKRQHQHSIKDLNESWNGGTGTFSLTAYGFGILGTLKVWDHEVIVEGTFPLLAAPFKSKIESMIRSEASRILATTSSSRPLQASPSPNNTSNSKSSRVRMRGAEALEFPLQTWLFKKPIHLFCGVCDKHIPSTIAWICPYCDTEHRNIRLYSFAYGCKTCKRRASSFECPHCQTVWLFEKTSGRRLSAKLLP